MRLLLVYISLAVCLESCMARARMADYLDESEGKAIDPGTVVSEGVGYKLFFSGDSTDVSPKTIGSILLVGGGGDRDDAMQWFVNRSGKGDIVVLRESGSDGYNSFLMDFGAHSVRSILFSSRVGAEQTAVIDAVRKAEGIFFAGGDQSNYIKFLKDSPIETEVNAAIARGVPVGGTSAGLAVLGEFVYSAMGESALSPDLLKNPYHPDLTLDRDFLVSPFLKGVITDTHFVARDRMGRLTAFMARLFKDGWVSSVHALGVDERVAIGMDEKGMGTVFADDGFAYALFANHSPSTCAPDKPLSFDGIQVLKIGKGSTFDFKKWSGTSVSAYTLNVKEGVLSSPVY